MSKKLTKARAAAILENPMAAEAQLLALAVETKWLRDVLQHPNCPSELWWTWLESLVVPCLRSPAAPLHILEDPTRFQEIWEEFGGHAIGMGVSFLDEKTYQLFLADCAEHVLFIWNEMDLKEPDILAAIQARRRYGQGQLSKKAMEALLQTTRTGIEAAGLLNGYALHLAVEEAGEAACAPVFPMQNAVRAVVWYAEATNASPEQAEANEERWQWLKLWSYLRAIYLELPDV